MKGLHNRYKKNDDFNTYEAIRTNYYKEPAIRDAANKYYAVPSSMEIKLLRDAVSAKLIKNLEPQFFSMP